MSSWRCDVCNEKDDEDGDCKCQRDQKALASIAEISVEKKSLETQLEHAQVIIRKQNEIIQANNLQLNDLNFSLQNREKIIRRAIGHLKVVQRSKHADRALEILRWSQS